jgi:uncharacterized protein YbjT (DUF2867 family)
MADLHVVLGATGNVGGIIASRLLEAGKRVRAVARHADRLAPLVRRGAEAAAGSIDDPAFLRKALEGARAAFVLLPPNFAPGVRATQDRTAALIGDALEAAKVTWAVSLSSVGAQAASGNGPIAGLHALEARLDRVPGLSPLHLRPGYFLENHLASIGMIRGMGMIGSALRPDLKMPQIAVRDVGEAAARRFLALDWKGRVVEELHGERSLTMSEVATALGKAIGHPDLSYVQFPYVDAQRGMVQAGLPEEMAALYVEMAKGFNEGQVATTQQRSPATTTPTTIERWSAEVFAPAFRAGT